MAGGGADGRPADGRPVDGRPAALITGAASGIGRALAVRLAADGYDLTLTDLAAAALEEAAAAARAAGAGAAVRTCVGDVADASSSAAAFSAHVAAFGRLDLAVLNAGIGERGDFLGGDAEAEGWERTLAVDLTAVLAGARQALRAMAASGRRGGDVLAVSSAAGYFPVAAGPVYAAAKAGVVHFVRSLGARGDLAAAGRRVLALCPQYVDTPLVRTMLSQTPHVARAMMGPLFGQPLLSPDAVAAAAVEILRPGRPSGGVGLLLQSGKLIWPFARADAALLGGGGGKAGGGKAGERSKL
jgi:NAD(P)-dependent dehydrogenase (short-subunit alcohol dehydrogenase family)